MPQLPLLTAIIPFHNFEQNFKNLQIIIQSAKSHAMYFLIICDGLDEEEFDFLNNKFNADRRILLLQVDFNSAAKSRNEGLKRVKTDWVVFWDCDDLVNVDKFLELIESPKFRNFDLIVGQIQCVDYLSGAITATSNSNSIENLAVFPAFTRIIYRSRLLHGLEFPDIPLCEDQCFLASVMSKIPHLVFSPDVIYTYRVNNFNQSSYQLFDPISQFNA